ncbi:MAG: hypothetical protein QOE00_571 [Ilumatobacteraceae bacterium]
MATDSRSGTGDPQIRGPAESVAFLLSKLGSEAGSRFATRLEPLGLEPRQVGILRMVAASGGESQLELSSRLGIQPSRMVTLLDDLERRRYVERRVNPEDRRARSLHLTTAGRKLLAKVATIGLEHERETCAALSGEQRAQLLALLRLMADVPGNPIDVHPGLRHS